MTGWPRDFSLFIQKLVVKLAESDKDQPPVHKKGALDGEMAAETKVDLSGDIPSSTPLQDGISWLGSQKTLFPAKPTVEWISAQRQGLKAWTEFFKTSKFKAPSGPSVMGKRVALNIEQFQSNYLCVFVILLVYCIVTSPMLLFALAACFGMLYVIRVKNLHQKIRISGRELSPAYQYAFVGLLAFPLFYAAGAGSVIFWVIGASIFMILLHAVMYASEPVPGAEFIDMDVV